MVPDSPTVTNNPVVVELSVFVVLDELLDEVQDMEMKLKRNRERMMSRCFTWFPISGLGKPKLYQNLMWITMCGGFYDIVVFFDCEVFWGVFVLEGGLLVFLTNFIRHKFTYRFWFGIFPLIWWSKI